MPIQAKEVVIDDKTFTITQFLAVKGFKIKARLMKLVLPVLSSMLGDVDLTDPSVLDSDVSDIMGMSVFQKLADVIEPEEFVSLFQALLSEVIYNGQPIDFNNFFAANYDLAYKLAYEVIKVNNFLAISGITNLLSQNVVVPQES